VNKKKTAQIKWITTRHVSQWDGKRYVTVEEEGYWYDGPIAYAHEAANTGQEAFRFYDSTDTAVDAQNTDPTTLDVDTEYQFCVRIKNVSNDTAENNQTYQFQYNHAGTGWTDVGVSDGGGIKVDTATAGLTDGATYGTDRLTGATESRLNGYEETSSARPATTLGVNTYAEFIYGFTIDSALVANNDNIDVRIIFSSGGSTLDFYDVNPSITVNEAASTPLSGGAGVGTYSLSGAAATTLVNELVSAAAGSYSLSGAAVGTSTATPLAGGAEAGAYALSGAAANTEYNEVLSAGAEAGAYTLTGANVTTEKVTAETESFDPDAFDGSNAFDTDAFALIAAAVTTLTAVASSYALAGTAANTEYHQVASAAPASYSLSGAAVNTEYHQVASAGAGSYSLSGADVATTKASVSAAGTGTYSLSGTDVTTTKASVSAAGTGTYTLNGASVNFLIDELTAAGVGSYALSGADVSFLTDELIGAGAGSYALAGTDITTAKATLTVGGVGTYVLSGAAVTFLTDELVSAGVGSYDLSGTATSTTKGSRTSADVGTYTLNGVSVSFLTSELVSAGAGAYALTGQDVTTAKVAADISFDNDAFDPTNAFDADSFSIVDIVVTTMDAGVGSYTLTGAAAATEVSHLLDAGVGTYALDGADVSFLTDELVTAGVGSYALTGTAISDALTVPAGVGSYTLNGTTVSFITDELAAAGVGTYALSGANVTTTKSAIIYVGVGTYTLNGTAISFKFDNLGAVPGSYTLTGKNVATLPLQNISFDNQGFDDTAFDINSFNLTESGSPTMYAASGTYTLTGADATTTDESATTTMGASAGAYSLTGADIDTYPQPGWTAFPFTVDWIDLDPQSPFYGVPELAGLVTGDICVFKSTTTPGGNAVSMDGTGRFTVTGTVEGTNTFDYFFIDISDGTVGTTEQITVLGTTILSAATGSYTLSGAAATTAKSGVVFPAGVGTYTLSGADVVTSSTGDIVSAAGVGSYVLSGQDVVTTYDRPIAAGVGVYTLSGTDIVTTYFAGIDAGVGVYLLTGADVGLEPLQKTLRCTLVDRNGTPLRGLYHLSWAWFDDPDPVNFIAPTHQGQLETTNSVALMEIKVPYTTLNVGDTGTLVLRSDDGAFFGAYNLVVEG
jgi:hypothetical protein